MGCQSLPPSDAYVNHTETVPFVTRHTMWKNVFKKSHFYQQILTLVAKSTFLLVFKNRYTSLINSFPILLLWQEY